MVTKLSLIPTRISLKSVRPVAPERLFLNHVKFPFDLRGTEISTDQIMTKGPGAAQV